MKWDQLTGQLEMLCPKQAALDFDNVGLLVGRKDKEIEKVYLAVDALDEVIEDAIHWGADLLLTHHPLIFSGMKSVTDQDFIGRRVVKLLQNDLNYYAIHTNYDVKRMADLAAEKLNLKDPQVLEVTAVVEEREEGIGKIGNLETAKSLRECTQLVKEGFGLPDARVFGDLEMKITRAAICPGSGKSVIDEAIAKKAQVLITGDIGHHEGIDAVARDLAIIDAGHYGTEYMFMEDMKKYFQEQLPEIQVKCAQVCHPFQTI